jgi:hypothetical protein
MCSKRLRRMQGGKGGGNQMLPCLPVCLSEKAHSTGRITSTLPPLNMNHSRRRCAPNTPLATALQKTKQKQTTRVSFIPWLAWVRSHQRHDPWLRYLGSGCCWPDLQRLPPSRPHHQSRQIPVWWWKLRLEIGSRRLRSQDSSHFCPAPPRPPCNRCGFRKRARHRGSSRWTRPEKQISSNSPC